MKFNLLAVFILSLVVSSYSLAENAYSPFILNQKSKEELIKQMREDFILVESGKKPKYAKFDEGQALLSDGGTVKYKAKGYTIIAQKTLGQLLGVNGYFYGPIVKIDDQKLSDMAIPVSSIKFYSTKDFQSLIQGK